MFRVISSILLAVSLVSPIAFANTIELQNNEADFLYALPQDVFLAFGSRDRSVHIYDRQTKGHLRSFQRPENACDQNPNRRDINYVSVSLDFGLVAMSGAAWFGVFDGHTGKSLWEERTSDCTSVRLDLSPDGKYLAFNTAGSRHSVLVYEAKTGVLVHRFHMQGELRSTVKFSEDGKSLFGGYYGALMQWDMNSGNGILTTHYNGAIKLSGDRRLAMTECRYGEQCVVSLMDLSRPVLKWRGDTGWHTQALISWNGSRVLRTIGENTEYVETATDAILKELPKLNLAKFTFISDEEVASIEDGKLMIQRISDW